MNSLLSLMKTVTAVVCLSSLVSLVSSEDGGGVAAPALLGAPVDPMALHREQIPEEMLMKRGMAWDFTKKAPSDKRSMAWDFTRRSDPEEEKRAMAWDFTRRSADDAKRAMAWDFTKRAMAWDFTKRSPYLAAPEDKRAMAWDFTKKYDNSKRAMAWDFTKKSGAIPIQVPDVFQKKAMAWDFTR